MSTQVPTPDYKGHANLAEMIKGHIRNWRECLQEKQQAACVKLDRDDASYWDHELKALDEIEAAALAEIAASK